MVVSDVMLNTILGKWKCAEAAVNEPRAEGYGKRMRMGRWCRVAAGMVAAVVPTSSARAQQLSLEALVTPSTVIRKDGKPVTFAIHGFVEFRSLAELFPYIAKQEQRWKGKLNDGTRQQLEPDLLRRGVESRVVSMVDERPLETLLTHTGKELREAIARVEEPVPAGYAEAFVAVQEKWKHALNCWSASPSIGGRVLSNWYPIEEGIRLYGATYDSTEHFWQAVKYHPDLTVGENALGHAANFVGSQRRAAHASHPSSSFPR